VSDTPSEAQPQSPPPGPKIVVMSDGPYEVTGSVPLMEQAIKVGDDGHPWEYEQLREFRTGRRYRLCRCGRSESKPFCDDSHERVGFDGTETADRTPYAEQAEVVEGTEMSMTDVTVLCALARFCQPHGDAWHLLPRTDDPDVRDVVRHETEHCPAGRLVGWMGRPGEPGAHALEPNLEPSISVLQDEPKGVSGPLWVRGGITIESADGSAYEVRNRVTLCRCGMSGNKPFCDGSHIPIRFRDHD